MVIINPAHILKVPLITLQDMFYKTLYHRRTLKKYFLPLSESIHSELLPILTSAGHFPPYLIVYYSQQIINCNIIR